MTNRYVFLDIDGPVIPEPIYFLNKQCSFERVFSNSCIGWVKRLLDVSGAKLVTNSMHNYYPRVVQDELGETNIDLRDDLIAAGIPADNIHPIWRTQFGHNSFDKYPRGGHPRLIAINNWLKEFGGESPDWVGFDDENYGSENLIHVSFQDGITFAHFSKACGRWDVNPYSMILA